MIQAIDRDNSGYIDAGELGKLGAKMNKEHFYKVKKATNFFYKKFILSLD